MREAVPIDQALACYFSDLEMAGRSSRTISSYRSYLKPLTEWPNDSELRAIIRARLTNPRTARNVHGILASFFAWCTAQGYYSVSPMKAIPKPARKPRPHRYLTKAQVRDVWNACDSDEERLIVRLLLLGLRARELLGLTFDDVDRDRGALRVLKSKGSKPRVIAVDQPTIDLMTPQMFAFSYSTLLNRIKDLGKKAGVPWLRPHDFRRTWGTHALLEGMNITSVKTLGGWTDNRMVELYAASALDEAALRDAQRMGLTARLLDSEG